MRIFWPVVSVARPAYLNIPPVLPRRSSPQIAFKQASPKPSIEMHGEVTTKVATVSAMSLLCWTCAASSSSAVVSGPGVAEFLAAFSDVWKFKLTVVVGGAADFGYDIAGIHPDVYQKLQKLLYFLNKSVDRDGPWRGGLHGPWCRCHFSPSAPLRPERHLAQGGAAGEGRQCRAQGRTLCGRRQLLLRGL